MNNKISTVIFDFGCVLNFPPEASHYQKMADMAGISRESFNKTYWGNRAEYDCGTIDGPAYWTRIAKASGKTYTSELIEKLILNDTLIWMRTNPVMMTWAQTLRSNGLKVAILSNMPIEIARYMRQNAPWLSDFDHVCFSAEIQLAKPDAPIYHACLKAVHSKPEECLFIDDRPENVEGAQAVGLHTLMFVSAPKLAVDVRPFGLPALRAD